MELNKELFLVYLMNDQGTYGKPKTVEGLQEAIEFAVIQADNYPEIRVCDMLDCLVYHIKDGEVVFPERTVATPVEVAEKQTNPQPIPWVVFVADLPTDANTMPELGLPFAYASDADTACKLVEEAYKDIPNCHVLDAMNYERLMEIADMLEEFEPDYPEGVEQVDWRPLDIGWAVRQLKKGCKVRFNTWNKGEYIQYRNGEIVDRSGTPWRPSRKEVMESGWEVADE